MCPNHPRFCQSRTAMMGFSQYIYILTIVKQYIWSHRHDCFKLFLFGNVMTLEWWWMLGFFLFLCPLQKNSFSALVATSLIKCCSDNGSGRGSTIKKPVQTPFRKMKNCGAYLPFGITPQFCWMDLFPSSVEFVYCTGNLTSPFLRAPQVL